MIDELFAVRVLAREHWPSPDKPGGLNGSMQHLLEVFLLGVYEADFVRER
jgi:hypothetical protein